MALSSHVPLPKTLLSSKQLSFFVKFALFAIVLPPSNGVTGDEASKQAMEFSAEPFFFSSKKLIKLIPKTIGNRKKRLSVKLRSGDKHHLRKSSVRKAQIRKAFVPLTGLICAFRSNDVPRWCLSPERNLTQKLFFLFPIAFGINIYCARKIGTPKQSPMCIFDARNCSRKCFHGPASSSMEPRMLCIWCIPQNALFWDMIFFLGKITRITGICRYTNKP